MKKYPILYTFVIFILGLTLLDVISKDKDFSELENRKLTSKPEFTMKSFFKGEFSSKYEKYINDQFVFRDGWIDIKSKSEDVLGKLENNGIVYGKDGFMFEKIDTIDIERVNNNVNAINEFSEKVGSDVTVMISPNSSGVYRENLPSGSLILNQEVLLNDIYKLLKNTKNINLLTTFESEKDNYIFYKTDHHWTTYGAYLAYEEFIRSVGMEPVNLESLDNISVDNFYGTYYSKAKDSTVKGDTLTYYKFEELEMKIGDDVYDSIYDYSKLDTVDKYGAFLRGNNGLTIIKNKSLKNHKKLLVFKDSYANSLVPFLTQNYEEIHVIDLRHYNSKVSEYMDKNKFEDILILYNINTFISDVNVIRIKY